GGACPPRGPSLASFPAGFSFVSARGPNICVIGNGQLRCYGPGFTGNVLSSNTSAAAVGVAHACWFERGNLLAGTLRCTGSAIARGPFDGGELPEVFLLTPAGNDFTCATGLISEFSCWGRNDQLQLGAVDGGAPVFPPALPFSSVTALGWTHACQVFGVPDGGQRLSCWGDDSNGKLGLPPGAGPRLPTLIQP
ncbi:MAG: hypothetical protein JNM69_40225, partial [Archangium sp.]|nr:hypothetical protein [Archangium sp.]